MNIHPTRLAVSIFAIASLAAAQTTVQSWSGQGTFAGGLAYDPITDEVWVIDQTNDNMSLFTRSGTLINTFPAPIGTLPIGGFVDPVSGDLWVCDEGEIVYSMDRNGNIVQPSWSTLPAISDVSAMTFDPASRTVFISNDSSNIVQEYDLVGTPIGTPINVSPAGSVDADGITYNPLTQTLYLGEDTGDQILEVNRTGALLNSWQVGGIVSPEGLSLDTRTGSLWVASGSGSTIYELSGIVPAPTGSVSTGGAGCPGPNGVVPVANASDVLQIDRTVDLAVQTGLAGTPGLVYFALGSTQTQIPLAQFGAPACNLWTVPIDAFGPFTTNHNDRAGVTVRIPNDTALVGLTFEFQALILTPSGLFASNAFSTVLQ